MHGPHATLLAGIHFCSRNPLDHRTCRGNDVFHFGCVDGEVRHGGAATFQEILRTNWINGACGVREFAFPWIGIMKPLGKEATVQGHKSTMVLRDFVQSLLQPTRERAVAWHGGRRYHWDEAQYGRGRCFWC